MKSSIVVLAGLLGVIALGCGALHDDGVASDVAALTEDSGESSGAGDAATTLATVPLESIASPGQLASAETAALAASVGPTFFKPAGCVTVTRQGPVVTHEFKGCTGPFGLVSVNGTLITTFSVAGPGMLKFDEQSQDLVVGKTPITQSASGTITFSGSKRLVSWTGTYSGATPKGLPIKHNGSYSGVYDAANGCVELDGSASTSIGLRGVKTTTTGYKRCGLGGICPSAGTITATGLLSKLTVKITYLGGGMAELTLPSGKVHDYTMAWCLAL